MATETSSWAAASRPVVRAAAVALAEWSAEPSPAKSVAAVSITSGSAMTKDMGHLPASHDQKVEWFDRQTVVWWAWKKIGFTVLAADSRCTSTAFGWPVQGHPLPIRF